ncbi:carboxypeptidase M32 [Prochlorococcus sp. MIT 1341]|uniref:carboxypeptidase M32 n=1 Tax=Prochlorococcus sp. MIT 1341 TaxID=3096221 RepID=UPI002A765B43|nr:carboxypeptidase M32 [Prochlorococcus sp. MIT 1341]
MDFGAWERLGDYLRQTQLLGSIQNTLYWDQNTAMPFSGASWRGEQLTFVARELHARQTSPLFVSLLEEAKDEFEKGKIAGDLTPSEQWEKSCNIRLLEQDLQRHQRLDSRLICEIAEAKAIGYHSWQNARASNDFLCFATALRRLIDLRKEQARQLQEPRSCWETLAQPFEPDVSYSRLLELFEPLKERLPCLIERFRSSDFSITRKEWDLKPSIQKKLCEELLMEWGRDPSIACVGNSPHPFSITLGPCDFRLTTRIVSGQPLSSFLAVAHEWGHSLYEQGLPSTTHQWFAWPLGQATSMGLHESQSLFWENRVARSKAFADRWWRKFKKAGAPIGSSDEFWRLMNPLIPGPNRVEADELSYGLHILIRTDLEIALLEKDLEVEEIPHEWNLRYMDLLGLTPKNDLEGCLQDVHWSEGLFGYFPSYLLGHLISAQLSEAMSNDLNSQGVDSPDPISKLIYDGEESTLLDWLRQNVHLHGRSLNAEELVKSVSGKKLSSGAFLSYLETKLDLLEDCS